MPERPRKPAPPDAVSPWALIRSANDHPFIFKRNIRKVDPAARPGDIVVVYDRDQALLGRALYNPASQIALRVLARGDTAVDETFWRDRLAGAVDLRRRLKLDEVTDAYRLIHAEGDGLSGLIVERYADRLVFELFSLGMYQRWEMLADILTPLLGPPMSLDRPHAPSEHWQRIARVDARVEQLEGFRAATAERDAAQPVTIREHGVRYRVDVSTGHKTGFFCDQRDNRRRFAGFCNDAEVLDVGCYTGGFGLCAKLLGNARAVTSVDLDEAALAMARTNINLNNARIQLVHADAFNYLRQMIDNKRQFDCVVCDPPKFAPTKADVETALRKYHDLNRLAVQVVHPGGILLTCSCSGLIAPDAFVEAVHQGARRAGRDVQTIDRTGAAPDHPVMLNCPESAYLKALWCRVL